MAVDPKGRGPAGGDPLGASWNGFLAQFNAQLEARLETGRQRTRFAFTWPPWATPWPADTTL